MQKVSLVKHRTADDALRALPEWLQNHSLVKSEKHFVYNCEAIGLAIRNRRLSAKMSLRSMARWISVSPTYLSDLERGLRPWPLSRIEDATNVLEMAERIEIKK